MLLKCHFLTPTDLIFFFIHLYALSSRICTVIESWFSVLVRVENHSKIIILILMFNRDGVWKQKEIKYMYNVCLMENKQHCKGKWVICTWGETIFIISYFSLWKYFDMNPFLSFLMTLLAQPDREQLIHNVTGQQTFSLLSSTRKWTDISISWSQFLKNLYSSIKYPIRWVEWKQLHCHACWKGEIRSDSFSCSCWFQIAKNWKGWFDTGE